MYTPICLFLGCWKKQNNQNPLFWVYIHECFIFLEIYFAPYLWERGVKPWAQSLKTDTEAYSSINTYMQTSLFKL